jgi:hypothetical protein
MRCSARSRITCACTPPGIVPSCKGRPAPPSRGESKGRWGRRRLWSSVPEPLEHFQSSGCKWRCRPRCWRFGDRSIRGCVVACADRLVERAQPSSRAWKGQRDGQQDSAGLVARGLPGRAGIRARSPKNSTSTPRADTGRVGQQPVYTGAASLGEYVKMAGAGRRSAPAPPSPATRVEGQ